MSLCRGRWLQLCAGFARRRNVSGGQGRRSLGSEVTRPTGSLQERLDSGEIVTIADGYIYAFERRGYCQAGAYIPEVVLEQPQLIRQQHEEFAHAGSDILIAVTYFTNREKLRLIGREGEMDRLNMSALRIAREVADNTGTLMAGNLGNTTVYKKDEPDRNQHVEETFKEQVQWAAAAGADLILAETFYDYGEALLALRAVHKYGNGLPAIVSMTPLTTDMTYDGVALPEALRRLEAEGAAAVGLNCSRGPESMLPILAKCREAVKGHLGCIPVPYRTTEKQPVFQSLTYPGSEESCFVHDLDIHMCGRGQVARFAEEARRIGVSYLGLCCGNSGAHFRSLCEALGRKVPASRFSPDFSLHFAQGDTERVGGAYHQESVKSFIAGTDGSATSGGKHKQS